MRGNYTCNEMMQSKEGKKVAKYRALEIEKKSSCIYSMFNTCIFLKVYKLQTTRILNRKVKALKWNFQSYFLFNIQSEAFAGLLDLSPCTNLQI